MFVGPFPETPILYVCDFHLLCVPFTGEIVCQAPRIARLQIAVLFTVMLTCCHLPHPLPEQNHCSPFQFLSSHILLRLLDSWPAKMRKWKLNEKGKTQYLAHLSEALFFGGILIPEVQGTFIARISNVCPATWDCSCPDLLFLDA